MTESSLENQTLDWLRETGWDIQHGPDIAHDGPTPMRRDYGQVLLESEIIAAVHGIALSSLHDKAFDRGLLTFDAQARMVLSAPLRAAALLTATIRNTARRKNRRQRAAGFRRRTGRRRL